MWSVSIPIVFEKRNKQRRDRVRKKAQFIANPYRFTSKLLGGRTSGRLECPQERLEAHLKLMYRDEHKDEPLGHCDLLEEQPLPSRCFDLKEPTWAEISEVVQKGQRQHLAPVD